jgi:hypothetical protein
LYFSCTQEKEYINENNHPKIDFQQTSFKEALSMPVFNNAYSKIAKKKVAFKGTEEARTALEDQFGFTIVTDAPIRIIIDQNGTIFYTILIERDIKEELKFENLMIQVKNDETSAAIFKYTMEEKGTISPAGDYTINDITSTFYTDLNIEGRMFFNSDGDTCFSMDVIRCTIPDHRPAGHIATQECWDAFGLNPNGGSIYNSTAIVCMNDGGGGGGGNGGNGGTSGGNSNNTGGLGSSGGSSDPTVLSPIPCRTANCIEADVVEDPCEKLNKLFNTGVGNLNLNPILNSLLPTLSQNGENGRTLRKSQAGLVGVQNIPATNTNSINGPVGPTVFGEIHTHPFQGPYAAYPMFSWTDVNRLLDLYNHTGTWNQSDVVSILVVKDDLGVNQIYSLVIRDITLFSEKLNEKLNQFPIFMNILGKLEILNDELANKYSNDNNYERAFLEHFSDFGIDVHKANSAITNWEKLSFALPAPISGQNTVIQTPCN